jgi:aminodeoxyfutalosine synthase
MLDNIPHIKAYWVMMTPRIAQIALRFGADDIDGTIVEERIYHDAGATTTQGLRRAELAAPDPQGGPRAGGARHAVPPVERTEATFTVLV